MEKTPSLPGHPSPEREEKNDLQADRLKTAFGYLTEQEIEALLRISELRFYKENETIFSEANPAEYFFLLLKGTVQMTFTHKINLRVSPGMIFGDWAFLNKTTRLATAKALSGVEVAAISSTGILNTEALSPGISLKVILNLAGGLVRRLLSDAQVSTESLLEQGEFSRLEFKSTLRKNLYTGKKDPAMERAALKTLAAFLNTDGGVLLIGVDDQGEVLGLEQDEFRNTDKLFLHLNHLISDRLGQDALQDICYGLSRVRGMDVLRVDCTPAPHPVFYRDKSEEAFFVRNGPATISLSISEAINYIRERF